MEWNVWFSKDGLTLKMQLLLKYRHRIVSLRNNRRRYFFIHVRIECKKFPNPWNSEPTFITKKTTPIRNVSLFLVVIGKRIFFDLYTVLDFYSPYYNNTITFSDAMPIIIALSIIYYSCTLLSLFTINILNLITYIFSSSPYRPKICLNFHSFLQYVINFPNRLSFIIKQNLHLIIITNYMYAYFTVQNSLPLTSSYQIWILIAHIVIQLTLIKKNCLYRYMYNSGKL